MYRYIFPILALFLTSLPLSVGGPIDDALEKKFEQLKEESDKRLEKQKADITLKVVKSLEITIEGDDPIPDPPPLPDPVPPTPDPNPPANNIEIVGAVIDPVTGMKMLSGKTRQWITVQGRTRGKIIQYVAKSDRLRVFPPEQLANPKNTVVDSDIPGDYELLFYTAINDLPTPPDTIIIRLLGAQPPPVPPIPVPPIPVPPIPVPPNPNPPIPVPPPNPTAVKLYITVVDNALSTSPAAVAIETDIQLRKQIEAMGHTWEILNTSVPRAKLFKKQVDTLGGVPCITIMDASKPNGQNWLNTTVEDLKLPDTSQGVLNLINKYTTPKSAARPSPNKALSVGRPMREFGFPEYDKVLAN